MGVKVVPALTPLALNPVPDAVTLEIVTFAFPLLVSVTPSKLLPPTLTVPKPRLVGLTPSREVVVAPLPLKEIASGELEALLATNRVPDTLPTLAGAKATLQFALCPGLRVKGRVSPLSEKPLPEMAA